MHVTSNFSIRNKFSLNDTKQGAMRTQLIRIKNILMIISSLNMRNMSMRSLRGPSHASPPKNFNNFLLLKIVIKESATI